MKIRPRASCHCQNVSYLDVSCKTIVSGRKFVTWAIYWDFLESMLYKYIGLCPNLLEFSEIHWIQCPLMLGIKIPNKRIFNFWCFLGVLLLFAHSYLKPDLIGHLYFYWEMKLKLSSSPMLFSLFFQNSQYTSTHFCVEVWQQTICKLFVLEK